MYDDSDKTYLIGNYVIEIWEGQHPTEHAHCWKWRITDLNAEESIDGGIRDFQEDAHIAALKRLTYHSLRAVEDRETLEVLWPGFAAYKLRGPGLAEDEA